MRVNEKKIKAKTDRTIINIESQKQLARLLATEDIQVTVGNFKTAYFDVKNRILGLPAWNTDTKSVSDLLVGHEVGHALFTPEDSIEKFKERFPTLPFSVANIVEDIRIERMIQLKYPGLVRCFNEGYSHLNDTDIFKIDGEDVNKMSFMDRLNLKGKLRHLIDIDFSPEEQILFDKCYNCQTYDDVLNVIEDIAKHISNEEPPEEPEKGDETETEHGDGGDDADSGEGGDEKDQDGESEENGSDGTTDEDVGEDPVSGNGGGDLGHDDERDYDPDPFKSETQDALNKHLEELGEMAEDECILNSLTDATATNAVYPFEQVQRVRKASPHYNDIMAHTQINEEWMKFKNETKKNVMVLCKEFERRKAAHQYQRATQSTTGSIDVNKLHSYKFEDRIFKSITNLADAKNHGMNIFIDNSGSMSNCISDVIKQTIQLIMFCKTVGIPFKVYSFTSLSGRTIIQKDGTAYSSYESKRDFFREHAGYGNNLDIYTTHIVELFNSSLKKLNHEKALKELFIQSGSIKSTRYLEIPGKPSFFIDHNAFNSPLETMGGTPLVETLVIANTLIKNFRKAHNVEKMITVFLTDGDGQNPQVHEMKPCDPEDEEKGGHQHNFRHTWHTHNYIKIGRSTVDISKRNALAYSELVNVLKKETGTKMIGFYLCSGVTNGKNNAHNSLAGKTVLMGRSALVEKCRSEAKIAKSPNCYAIEGGFNYDQYFIIDNLNKLKLHDDEEFTVPEGIDTNNLTAVNRNKLATSFKKHNTTKRQSRVFLNKFIATVI